jgi:hypothetical protein
VDDRTGSRRGRKFGIALAAIGVVGSTLAIQGALAHKVTFDSNLQLKLDSNTETASQFSGKVTSTRAGCEVGRPVTLSVNGTPIAAATTVVGGSWSASGPGLPKGSTVIATIPRKVLKRNKKHRHKCAPDSAQRRAN